MILRPARGLTFVTVLIVLAAAGAIYWIVSFGPAYLDNFQVKRILAESANYAYHEHHDDKLRAFIFAKLHENFDEEVQEGGRIVRQLKFDITNDDLQMERSEVPPRIDIWLIYSRKVMLPLVGQERTVTFTDHTSQDLSPVKW